MADQIFPQEYQEQIDAAERKRQLAQMLQQQAMGFKGAQSQGRIASKTSPLAWLKNAGTQIGTAYMAGKAQEEGSAAKKAFEADQIAETQRIQNLPTVDEQIKAGQASKFPIAKQLAKTLYDTQQKRLELGSNALKDADPATAYQIAQSGQMPGAYKLPEPNTPAVKTLPDGTQYIETRDRKGQPGIHFPPKGVNVNLPGNEANTALDMLKTDLKGRQGSAEIARDTLAANSRAVDALESGAKAGGAEGVKQGIRSALQAFGVNVPENAPTTQLQQALGNELLNNARKLAPVTGTDIKVLEGILGNINSDPTALTKAIAFNHAMALKSLGGYNNYLAEQSGNLKTPYAADLFRGAGSGFEMPNFLIGQAAFQAETARNYKNIGGDLSTFIDPVTGKPMDPNTQFNIKQPTAGFPGVNPANAPAAPVETNQPMTIDQLTPAQKQQLRQLLGN